MFRINIPRGIRVYGDKAEAQWLEQEAESSPLEPQAERRQSKLGMMGVFGLSKFTPK